MNSPFKFLDAYTPADKDSFFGREAETEGIYTQIYKSRMLLVYGQSGTGKTSLIQCGLGGRFDLTDWYPFLLRRNNNINDSLMSTLVAPLGGNQQNESITDVITKLYKIYLRPIYLIFDQMEELFILGSEDEQNTFINNIKAILNAELPCKIILVMREEYIAHLYDFEQVIPTLFNHRIRVEPMNYINIAKVITGSCERFNIKLESPDDTVQQIIDQLSLGNSGVQLPYLQVYMDRLWLSDFERTYPQGLTTEQASKYGNFPELVFTSSEIEELGNIEEVLEKFLRLQTQQMQTSVQTTYQDLPVDAVRQILDLFVTEDGTKRPVSYERKEGKVFLEEKQAIKLATLPMPAIREILDRLEKVRILRFTENLIELAHDSLADLIDKDRSTEQRQLNMVKKRLSASYLEYCETGVFLTEKQLASIEPFLPKLVLDSQLKEFLDSCEREVARMKLLEEERHKNELQLIQDKLDSKKRAATRQRWMIFIMFIIALWGLQLFYKANKALSAFQNAQIEKVFTSIENIEWRIDSLKNQYKPVRDSLLKDAVSELKRFDEKKVEDDTLKLKLHLKRKFLDSLILHSK
ncbi:MAG: ATP-binding protein [Saprospiraceae bacterium]|nr:ATP-binding protein [Saprospiraceae bacterium]